MSVNKRTIYSIYWENMYIENFHVDNWSDCRSFQKSHGSLRHACSPPKMISRLPSSSHHPPSVISPKFTFLFSVLLSSKSSKTWGPFCICVLPNMVVVVVIKIASIHWYLLCARFILKVRTGTFLAVQWLRLCALQVDMPTLFQFYNHPLDQFSSLSLLHNC